MADYLWGYFLNREELITTYSEAGGKIGTFNVKNPQDLNHARRAIAEYLIPGPLHVWYASLGDQDGIVFFVGYPDCDLRESVNVDLATRCYMFRRPLNSCELLEETGDLQYDLKRGGKSHRLKLLEFLSRAAMAITIRYANISPLNNGI